MSTDQYKNLDGPDMNSKNDDPSWKGNQSIELDVQTLSKNQLSFIKNFVENP
jgi:hypothetical protein